ncbi:MAG: hypothetical protein AAF735_08030 [Myxococcota bacterium]
MRDYIVMAPIIFLVACGAKTRFSPLNASPKEMQPRSPETVEIFSSKSPERDFVEVGMISARQSSGFSSEDAVLPALREEAANRGCDGLILGGSDDEVVSGALSNGATTVTTLKGLTGTCIVYR